MLRFVLDHLKAKNLCKNAIQKLLLVIRHVPDWYKTQEMRDKVITENGRLLKYIPDC